jgi:hypothetical protein
VVGAGDDEQRRIPLSHEALADGQALVRAGEDDDCVGPRGTVVVVHDEQRGGDRDVRHDQPEQDAWDHKTSWTTGESGYRRRNLSTPSTTPKVLQWL